MVELSQARECLPSLRPSHPLRGAFPTVLGEGATVAPSSERALSISWPVVHRSTDQSGSRPASMLSPTRYHSTVPWEVLWCLLAMWRFRHAGTDVMDWGEDGTKLTRTWYGWRVRAEPEAQRLGPRGQGVYIEDEIRIRQGSKGPQRGGEQRLLCYPSRYNVGSAGCRWVPAHSGGARTHPPACDWLGPTTLDVLGLDKSCLPMPASLHLRAPQAAAARACLAVEHLALALRIGWHAPPPATSLVWRSQRHPHAAERRSSAAPLLLGIPPPPPPLPPLPPAPPGRRRRLRQQRRLCPPVVILHSPACRATAMRSLSHSIMIPHPGVGVTEGTRRAERTAPRKWKLGRKIPDGAPPAVDSVLQFCTFRHSGTTMPLTTLVGEPWLLTSGALQRLRLSRSNRPVVSLAPPGSGLARGPAVQLNLHHGPISCPLLFLLKPAACPA